MSVSRRVLVYGASGYTGKLISECLAQRNIPFYAAGRNQAKLEAALDKVAERHGSRADTEVVTVSSDVADLTELFKKVDVVINVVGPFMQLGWPVVEACLAANCHYVDTTGEQDWMTAIDDKYGAAFEEKGLLLSPANSYMWAAGALAAEIALETEGVDSLDIAYQIDNALPSEASSMSFMRMQANPESQRFLQQNEFVAWPNDQTYTINLPHRSCSMLALPWGGAGEPVWFKDDARVLNCKVLTAFGDDIIRGVMSIIDVFNERSKGMNKAQREELTNELGMSLAQGEPEKDHLDVQRSVVVCYGQGRQVTKTVVLNVSAPYQWTGQICAEAAERILNGQLKQVGFRSAPQAFGHRELLQRFNELGYCSLPE
jgi:hypothetical protein